MKQIIAAVKSRMLASLHSMIFDFFRQFPDPTDAEVHTFAESLGMTPPDFERHIYELFTNYMKRFGEQDVPAIAKVVSSIRRRGEPKPGRIALAYMYAFPIAKAPDEAVCNLLGRLQKMANCTAHYIVSDRLKAGVHAFEIHSADGNIVKCMSTMSSLLQNFSWRVVAGNSALHLKATKNGMTINLLFM